jgi:hypothetical protein
MTTIVEKDSSGPDLGEDISPSNGVLTSCVCFSGGYSVWNCPPLEPKLPITAQKAPEANLSATSVQSRL